MRHETSPINHRDQLESGQTTTAIAYARQFAPEEDSVPIFNDIPMAARDMLHNHDPIVPFFTALLLPKWDKTRTPGKTTTTATTAKTTSIPATTTLMARTVEQFVICLIHIMDYIQ